MSLTFRLFLTSWKMWVDVEQPGRTETCVSFCLEMWISHWCCWPGYLYRAILLSKGECILGLKNLCICQDIMTLQKSEYISVLYWGHKKKSHGRWKWSCFRLSILCLALYANFHMKRITNDWSGIYIHM